MSAKKLKAFTLLELVVSMFISMLLIGVAYFLLNTISFYFKRLDQQAAVVSERQLMRVLLRSDVEHADSILARQGGLSFFADEDSLSWRTVSDSIIRVGREDVKGFHIGEVQLVSAQHPTLGVVEQLDVYFVKEEEAPPFHFTKVYPLKHFVH